MKKIRSKVIPLLCSLALVAPVYTLAQPASAAVVQSDNQYYFTDSGSGFVVKLINPQSNTLTKNVIDQFQFAIEWYDRNSNNLQNAGSVSDSQVTVSYKGTDGDVTLVPDGGVYTISNLDTGLKSSGTYNLSINIKNNSAASTSTSGASTDTSSDSTIYNGESGKVNVQLNYKNIDTNGARYVTDYTGGTKLSAFNGKVALQFPKDSFITDKSSISDVDSAVPDQSVSFNVYQPSSTSYDFVSNGYTVSSTQGNSNYQPVLPGTISISYNGDIPRDVALYNLSVLKEDSSGNWTPIGGVVNSSSKTVTASVYEFGTYAVGLNYNTYDIKNGSSSVVWSSPFVLALTYKGVINPSMVGGSSSSYYDVTSLNNSISREAFTVMLAKAMGWAPVPYKSNFADITSSDPNSNYIQAAVDNGIVQGKSPANFGVADLLTREEAAVMITHALNLKTDSYTNLDTVKKQLARYYPQDINLTSNTSTIDDWAIPFVYVATTAKVVNGSNGTYNPIGNLSYSEASAIVYKIMDKLGKFGR